MNFKRLTGKYASTAKVVDGTLILSLPDALLPVVWRMDLDKAKAAVLEVAPKENDHYALIIRMEGGETGEIAVFGTKKEAVAALMKASSALENMQGDARPVHAAPAPRNPGGGWMAGAFVGLAAVLLLGILTLLISTSAPGSSQAPSQVAVAGGSGTLDKAVVPPSPDDHVYGAPDAPVTLIEYADFECPYCLKFHPVAYQLVDGSGGKVNWVYRHVPLHGKNSFTEAVASECAAEQGGDDMFWRYGDALFSRTKSGGEGFPLENLAPLAGELGLDKDAFQTCLTSKKYDDKLNLFLQQAQAIKIKGTPGIVLYNNNTGKSKVFSGARDLKDMQAEISGMEQ